MDFEAASESLDRGTRLVSVRGEVDLATAPELLAIYPSRAAALNGDAYH
jgi:hypothetical protein